MTPSLKKRKFKRQPLLLYTLFDSSWSGPTIPTLHPLHSCASSSIFLSMLLFTSHSACHLTFYCLLAPGWHRAFSGLASPIHYRVRIVQYIILRVYYCRANIQRRGSILVWIVILSIYGADTIAIDLSLSALIAWFMKSITGFLNDSNLHAIISILLIINLQWVKKIYFAVLEEI